MAHLYVFWNEIWPWHIGLGWTIVALWATCIFCICHHLPIYLPLSSRFVLPLIWFLKLITSIALPCYSNPLFHRCNSDEFCWCGEKPGQLSCLKQPYKYLVKPSWPASLLLKWYVADWTSHPSIILANLIIMSVTVALLIWFLFRYHACFSMTWYEPCHKKTVFGGLWPGRTQTGLFSYRDKPEFWNIGYSNYRNYRM